MPSTMQRESPSLSSGRGRDRLIASTRIPADRTAGCFDFGIVTVSGQIIVGFAQSRARYHKAAFQPQTAWPRLFLLTHSLSAGRRKRFHIASPRHPTPVPAALHGSQLQRQLQITLNVGNFCSRFGSDSDSEHGKRRFWAVRTRPWHPPRSQEPSILIPATCQQPYSFNLRRTRKRATTAENADK